MIEQRCIHFNGQKPKHRHHFFLGRKLADALLLILLSTVLPKMAFAQGTLEDYQRAAKFLNAGKLVLNAKVQPYWLPDSERFYYSRQTPDGKEFVLVDPIKKTSEAAFDHARVAAALAKATGGAYTPETLPFDRFEFVENSAAIRFDVKDDQWTCRLAAGECTRTGKAKIANRGEAISPDGHWAAFLRDHNLYIRTVGNNPEREIQLTTDGVEDNDYASHAGTSTSFVSDLVSGKPIAPGVMWSPDSKKLLTYRLDQRKVLEMYLVQSVPPEGVRPRLFSYRYSLAGDPDLGLTKLMVFDIASGKSVVVDADPQQVTYQDPITMQTVWWSVNGQSIFYVRSERGFKELSMWAADAQTGHVRKLIDERGDPPVTPGPDPYGEKLPLIRLLANGNEIIWYSERDGWDHLYLYDGKTGALKNQITQGSWDVRDVDHVDETGRWVYFSASGREAGQDPYELHYYRIRLDGTGLQLLTPEEGNHTVKFSPSGKFMVDTWSRVSVPPVTVLRAADGTRVDRVGELERADTSKLKASGWRAPEAFHVKALDGETDLYGVIYRPSNFDSTKHYPVIEDIYPGPQMIIVPKTFDKAVGSQDEALAELGFIVVSMDGMGGPFRSHAFHHFSYGKLGQGGDLADHVAGLKQLAERYPYMDLNRVGIYGHSGGGFASARAILTYPDFYKVAVSSSGNHDQRGYIPVWGEQYEGYPVGDNYLEQVNSRLAANLKGKLLLAYGDMDDNVPPALTLQLVDALIKANRDFDLLVFPNRNHHGVSGDSYLWRRRWDYFVKNLLHVEPPENFKISAADK